MYLYWIDETMFLSFQLWFVWAHALCNRESKSGRPRRIGTTVLAITIRTMCIENNNWLRIRDDYRFIHKMMRQRTNARPYFNAMNKFNSVYNSMNKMKENRISKWKDAIESKWSVCHTRCHLATQFMTAQKFIYIQNRDQPSKDNLNCVFIEESGQKIGVNECKYSLDAIRVCMCVWLIVAGAEFEKQTQKAETNRQRDRQPKQYDWEIRLCFNGGVDGYKLTDLWLFADWNSKVSICTYCHQTLNRGNHFVYIRSFSPSEAALGGCWLYHQAHWTLQYLCRWIKIEQLSSSTWWIHFHLIFVVSFLLYFPYGYIEWLAPVYVYEPATGCEVDGICSTVQSLNVNGKCGSDAAEPLNINRD